jgi:hypothetical protein
MFQTISTKWHLISVAGHKDHFNIYTGQNLLNDLYIWVETQNLLNDHYFTMIITFLGSWEDVSPPKVAVNWPSTNQPWPRSPVRNLREVPGRAVPWPAPPAAWPRCTAMSPRRCQGWFVPAWALPLEAWGFGGWGRGGSWVDFLVDMDMLWGTVLLLGMVYYWCWL